MDVTWLVLLVVLAAAGLCERFREWRRADRCRRIARLRARRLAE